MIYQHRTRKTWKITLELVSLTSICCKIFWCAQDFVAFVEMAKMKLFQFKWKNDLSSVGERLFFWKMKTWSGIPFCTPKLITSFLVLFLWLYIIFYADVSDVSSYFLIMRYVTSKIVPLLMSLLSCSLSTYRTFCAKLNLRTLTRTHTCV